ncbi:YnfC family lipoprotein [Entomohabitans teleogrylli]|uniref:YnfC family lipoprotein n=1 Tax=Entomohabitans teleogrylli TaxID=1384589 RepID=UPI00073D51AE|nr:YnfC family lipoprotein [Entomohabitans teleogrylli]
MAKPAGKWVIVGGLAMALSTFSALGALKSEPFNPIMASFSNELDFDALRGQVKSFEQAMYNDQNKPVMYAKASFDQKGCLNSYEKVDSINNGKIKLVRDVKTNRLISNYDASRVISLNSDCQIVQVSGEGKEPKQYIYDKGFLVKVKGARDAWVYKEYFYTAEGMPKSIVFYGDERDFLLIQEPKKKLSDGWDYITEGFDEGKPVYQSVKKCSYDAKSNPTECWFVTATQQNGLEKKKVERIRYAVTYY